VTVSLGTAQHSACGHAAAATEGKGRPGQESPPPGRQSAQEAGRSPGCCPIPRAAGTPSRFDTLMPTPRLVTGRARNGLRSDGEAGRDRRCGMGLTFCGIGVRPELYSTPTGPPVHTLAQLIRCLRRIEMDSRPWILRLLPRTGVYWGRDTGGIPVRCESCFHDRHRRKNQARTRARGIRPPDRGSTMRTPLKPVMTVLDE
jgi:hypothetical protein